MGAKRITSGREVREEEPERGRVAEYEANTVRDGSRETERCGDRGRVRGSQE